MKKLFLLAVMTIFFSIFMISCGSRSGHKLEELKAAKEKAHQDSILAISNIPPVLSIDSFFIREPIVGEVYFDRLMPLLDQNWSLVGVINYKEGEDMVWTGTTLNGDLAGAVNVTFEKMPFDMAVSLPGIDDFIKWPDGSITVYIYGNPSEDPFDAHKKIKKFVGEVAAKMNGTMEILDYK